MGICSVNRPEWFIADLACLFYDYISVPIVTTLGKDTDIPSMLGLFPHTPTTLDQEDIMNVVNNSQLACVVCSRPLVPQVLPTQFICH